MATRYEEGATVYELAAAFACHRTTVADRLKKAGVTLRLKSPTPEIVELMSRHYVDGQTLQDVGSQFGFSPNTVSASLKLFGVRVRDTHGRLV